MASISTINPANGEKLAEYTISTKEEAFKYAEKAHLAFEKWKNYNFSERARLMHKLADLLKSEKEVCAKLMSAEMGKPITEARTEMDKCAWVCAFYAEKATDYLKEHTIETEHRQSQVVYRPMGVIFAIMPWNFPFWQVFRFLAPNLMGGNTAILKHASICSGTGQKIAELIDKAGFPTGVFQNIVLDNAGSSALIGHSAIAGVTITGSGRAGSAVAESAGKHLKKVVLEMGGSDPYLVLKDADLDLAADSIVKSRLKNAGQVCIAAKRVLVDQTVRSELQEKITSRLEKYMPANPMDSDTNLGPLAREDLRDTLHKQVKKSVEKGASLLMGGKIPEGEGFYYPATMLTNVRPGMPAFDEELFGPVMVLIEVKDTEEAIDLANQSQFGLGAAVFTRDLIKGEDIAKNRLEAGACFVNAIVVSDPRLPFGGIKQSGFGRELGAEGIREFMNIKTYVMD